MNNYHMHTKYCDGKDSAEDTVLSAIKLGCLEIGFSSHSYTSFDTSYCMSLEVTEEYKKEIKMLKEKYKDKINILCGIEQDYFSTCPTDCYDYVIGSVHYVLKDGNYLPVDLSKDEFVSNVEKYYGGDFFAFCEDYYKEVKDVYNKTKCDIIGHFDLVTKFNEGNCLFDTKNERYVKASLDALNALLKTPAKFEINTGAISRGYRKEPYPEDSILKIIADSGKKFVLSSDSHAKDTIVYLLNEEKEKLDSLGYKYCIDINDIKTDA